MGLCAYAALDSLIAEIMNSTKVQNPRRYGGAHRVQLRYQEYTTHMKNVHR